MRRRSANQVTAPLTVPLSDSPTRPASGSAMLSTMAGGTWGWTSTATVSREEPPRPSDTWSANSQRPGASGTKEGRAVPAPSSRAPAPLGAAATVQA